MDAPLPAPEMLIRPWRTATLVASLVAAVELVLLLIAAVLLLAKPLSHAMQRHAEAAAFATPKKAVKTTVPHVKQVVARPKLSRGETKVWVLNGNGRSGAAAGEAGRLQSAGYLVRGTANAKRTDYATTVIMYRSAYRGDAVRLAHVLGVKVVGPLDGLAPAALRGAQLVVLLGAR
jgi:hypothetical protein